MIPEPLAAAWRAVQPDDRVPDGLYGIFDWGGGTFDAAVVRWTGHGFELAGPTVGVDPLGGEDIDDLLYDHVIGILNDDTLAIIQGDDTRARHQLWNLRRSVRETKEALSSLSSASMIVASESIVVTRPELELLANDSVDQCVTAMLDCVAVANTTPDQLAGIRLTGDASQLPLVRDRLWATIGNHLPEPRPVGEAKAAVALGAFDAWHHPPTTDTKQRSKTKEPATTKTRRPRPRAQRSQPTATNQLLDAISAGRTSLTEALDPPALQRSRFDGGTPDRPRNRRQSTPARSWMSHASASLRPSGRSARPRSRACRECSSS